MFNYQRSVRINRLTQGEIEYARVQRLKQIHMWSIIREALTYLCFLSFLFVITYSNPNSNSFLQVDHLRKYLLNSRQTDLDYTKVCFLYFYNNKCFFLC